MPAIDRTGQRFTRLTVLRRAPRHVRHGGKAAWVCRCDCGVTSVVTSGNLRQGLVKSCGCLRSEKARDRLLTHGEGRTSHQSREYRAWCNMKTRCDNPRASQYADYGGRGIRVCDRWRESYEAFLADMGRCPPRHSLDRKDNNGQYEPENCRWAKRLVQANNKRNNRVLAFNGESLTLPEWARQLGVPRDTLKRRILLGWSIERALTEPLRRR